METLAQLEGLGVLSHLGILATQILKRFKKNK